MPLLFKGIVLDIGVGGWVGGGGGGGCYVVLCPVLLSPASVYRISLKL